jgi:hypothetical protein
MQLEWSDLALPGFLAGVFWYLRSHAPWVQAGVLQLVLDAGFSSPKVLLCGACTLTCVRLQVHCAGKAGYSSWGIHVVHCMGDLAGVSHRRRQQQLLLLQAGPAIG